MPQLEVPAKGNDHFVLVLAAIFVLTIVCLVAQGLAVHFWLQPTSPQAGLIDSLGWGWKVGFGGIVALLAVPAVKQAL